MGNSQKDNSNNKKNIKKSRSVTQGNCLACMPNYESYECSSLDHNELNIFKGFCQPKGKISPKSIAYLSKDQINFFKASAGRNISAIRFYLKKGVHVNTFDEDRTSPLHVAARHASIQVVEELINCGALIDITDSDGWTPLHVASYFQRPVVCHLLLKKGANPLIPNKDNKKPQDLAKDKKLIEIFSAYFSREVNQNQPKSGNSTNREKTERIKGTSTREHNESPRIEFSCDSIAYTEEPAKIPNNMIFPKQHKYYLYFKNLKVKNSNVNNDNRDPILPHHTINSLTFSDEDVNDDQPIENISDVSSFMFLDDSQIGESDPICKNLAMDYQLSKKSSKFKVSHGPFVQDFLHIRQNIPFKLKNVYTSSLSVKKGLKFQVNSSNITAKGNSYNNSNPIFLKSNTGKGLPPKPPSSNQIIPNGMDFSQSKNVAHYNKNPLTANKFDGTCTPESSRSILFVDNTVFSIKEFVKDELKSPQKGWQDHNINLETGFEKMKEFGVSLFNLHAINGVSFMLFIKAIKSTPPGIAKFLHNQRSLNEHEGGKMLPKKEKTQISAFLTNLNIKEILEVLNFYTESFIFRDMSFVSALKFFLNNFMIENDPEKIDILLYAFSRKYFKELRKPQSKEKNDAQEYTRKMFQNFDAVHMLAFATIMLDIEVHHAKRVDLDNVVKEFDMNVKGLNDGENFPKEFVNNIVEAVIKQNLIVLRSFEIPKEKPQLWEITSKNTDLIIELKKKNRENVRVLLLMIQNLGIIFKKTLGVNEKPTSVFLLENCNVKVKGPSFSFTSNEKKNNKLIIYGKFRQKEHGIISVKYKESLDFLLVDINDARKIVQYVEKIHGNSNRKQP